MSELNDKELSSIINNIIKNDISIPSELGEILIVKSSKGVGQGGTSFVKNIKLIIDKENIIENKFVIKFLAENIANNNESNRYKRFKQAFLNLLLLKNKKYTIPQIHFGKYYYNDDTIIPYLLMQKADIHKLTQVSNYNEFKNKFQQLLECIEYIHNNNIIHRDLKPENIFEFDGRIVLADFDISKFEDINHTNLVKTKLNDRIGNRDYSSPEQNIKGGIITVKSDWYAFGWLINFLITGREPVKGNFKIDYSKYSNDYIKYENLVNKLISVNPKDRPSNKDEILTLIDKEYQSDNLINTYPKTEKENLENFQNIISKYINSNESYSILESEDDINNFLSEISYNISFDSNFLCYTQGAYKYTIISGINKNNDNVYKKNWFIDNIEINILKIYVYSDIILGSQFFIIESNDFDLKIKGNKNIYDEWEGYYLYNNCKVINLDKISQNGYLNIDGKRINIKPDLYRYHRQLKKNIFIILPECLRKWENNDSVLNNFYESYLKNKKEVNLNSLKILPYKGYNNI